LRAAPDPRHRGTVTVGRSAEPRLQTKARRARSKYPLDPQSLWPKRAFNTFRQIIVPSNEESSLRAHPAALPGGEFFVE